MAEGSETPNGGHDGPEGRPRRGEGDLLAERRARRAAESGEAALTRRAEAAEATVQTLERHVSSLQQRLSEAEREHERMVALVEAERTAALEREHELRRVKQREYAEQQLRVEAEDRLLELDRDSQVEVERLSVRLGASEQAARELSRRLEDLQRQLAEAEHTAASELASVRADMRSVADQDLQARLVELERRAAEIQRGLDAERVQRARSERLIESMREGHRRMEAVLGEMKGIVTRATAALASERAASPAGRAPAAGALTAAAAEQPGGVDMGDALAAAVQRLRDRADAAAEPVVTDERDDAGGAVGANAAAGAVDVDRPTAPAGEEAASGGAATRPAKAVSRATAPGAAAPAQRPSHKHSRSLIGRLRMRRKQRRAR
jgi:hypothetical protein